MDKEIITKCENCENFSPVFIGEKNNFVATNLGFCPYFKNLKLKQSFCGNWTLTKENKDGILIE